MVFDTVADDIRSIRLEERCVKAETALGRLRRSSSASTAILDTVATSLVCGLVTLQRAGFVGELRALLCSRLYSIWCTHLLVYFKGKRVSLQSVLVLGDTPLLFPRPLHELLG